MFSLQTVKVMHHALPRHCAVVAAAAQQVIHEKLGIAHGCITTIHNLTNTQTIVDAPNTKKSDLRRAR
jgi:glyceraldehyde-3-phosphate dehydrogenase/erythrose-4-phosphate dehydrogenase